MNGKHTPGPWQAFCPRHDNYWEVRGSSPHVPGKHQVICALNGPWNAANYKANARLIAASPELFQALERLYKLADKQLTRESADGGIENQEALLQARAAIAKAKGEK